jgi:hypothetical protein
VVTNNARSENGVRHVRRRIRFVSGSDAVLSRFFAQVNLEPRPPHSGFLQLLHFGKTGSRIQGLAFDQAPESASTRRHTRFGAPLERPPPDLH